MSICLWEVHIKHFFDCLDLQAELVIFYREHHFYFAKKTDRKPFVYGGYFLENKRSEGVTSRQKSKTKYPNTVYSQ